MKKLLLSVAALIFVTVLLTFDETNQVKENSAQNSIARVENHQQS